MRQIFVDTSAWDAIADGGDPNHEVALLFRDEIAEQCRLVVTNYILDELYTLSKEIATEAWIVFEQFNVDKQWSFTDCVSYVVMKQRGITEVFAFDDDFAQMGFVRQP